MLTGPSSPGSRTALLRTRALAPDTCTGRETDGSEIFTSPSMSSNTYWSSGESVLKRTQTSGTSHLRVHTDSKHPQSLGLIFPQTERGINEIIELFVAEYLPVTCWNHHSTSMQNVNPWENPRPVLVCVPVVYNVLSLSSVHLSGRHLWSSASSCSPPSPRTDLLAD